MRKNTPLLLFIIALFAITSVNAQKIKVKKDQVLLEKDPIAAIEKIDGVYYFSGLGTKSNIGFSVDFHGEVINASKTNKWLTVVSMDKSQSTEVEMEYLNYNSTERAISDLFFQKYKLLTDAGIDGDAIKAFFAVDRPSLSEASAADLKAQTDMMDQIKNVDLSVSAKQKVIYKGLSIDGADKDRNVVVGKFSLSGSGPDAAKVKNIVEVKNLQGTLVGYAMLNLGTVNASFSTVKKKVTYDTKNNLTTDENTELFVKELVGYMAVNGVDLGSQIAVKDNEVVNVKREEQKEKFEEAKANSANIYFTPGYIMDEKDGKREGEIQFIAELVKDEGEGWKNVVDLDEANIGKKMVFKYENKKGKSRYDDYKSKDGELFCVTQNGKETCYRGMKVKNKGFDVVAGGLSSLSFDTSSYYMVIEESDDISLYRDAVRDNQYAIKIASENRGYEINNRREDKNIENLVEYLEGKVSAADLDALDFTKLEDMQRLVKLYKKQ